MSDHVPMVTIRKALAMQVCVPGDWTDGQVEEFANRENPAGTEHGWHIRYDGYQTRVACVGEEGRDGFVHIVLEC